jgi:hypothetical protein
MRESVTVLWFGPESRAQEARDAAGGVDFLLCRGFTARRVLAAIEALSGPVPDISQAASRSAITAS